MLFLYLSTGTIMDSQILIFISSMYSFTSQLYYACWRIGYSRSLWAAAPTQGVPSDSWRGILSGQFFCRRQKSGLHVVWESVRMLNLKPERGQELQEEGRLAREGKGLCWRVHLVIFLLLAPWWKMEFCVNNHKFRFSVSPGWLMLGRTFQTLYFVFHLVWSCFTKLLAVIHQISQTLLNLNNIRIIEQTLNTEDLDSPEDCAEICLLGLRSGRGHDKAWPPQSWLNSPTWPWRRSSWCRGHPPWDNTGGCRLERPCESESGPLLECRQLGGWLCF